MTTSDETSRKLHPWLRVVQNGDATVNATRADASLRMSCTLPSSGPTAPAPVYAGMVLQTAPNPGWISEAVNPDALAPLDIRPSLAAGAPAANAFVNVFVEFYPEQQGGDGVEIRRVQDWLIGLQEQVGAALPGVATTRGNFLCATVPVSALEALEREATVAYVHPAEPLTLLQPTVRHVRPGVHGERTRSVAERYGRGANVLIGLIDVGGFDFAHPDFLDDAGNTRFVAIWDQAGSVRRTPKGFRYGSEIRKVHMDAAIAASRRQGMPPPEWIEPQSQQQTGSHGTHVASIAAGRSGICSDAWIAGVLIDVPAVGDAMERRRTAFSDTSRITEAVEYLLGVAKELDLPISINISLGTNGGSHDGSSGVSRWLDAYLAAPGRSICVAAGNAGQERAHFDGDLGWVMGRIHTSGRIPSRGLEVELEWIVVGDGTEDWSENELEIWYSAQDRFRVSLKPPGEPWIVVGPREYVKNRRLGSGTTVSVFNELYHPTTGGNYISVYLSPNLVASNFRGIAAGVWKVRIEGEEVRDGRFDAWIERDDPMALGHDGARRLYRFPSFFSERSVIDSHTITSLACGHRVIAVANLDEAQLRINRSSSQGPTRDGRSKPEIAAPGTDIIAANGFSDSDESWIAMTGTSMASPYVAGVVGLMLARNRELTAAQCLGILQRTARPLAGASYEWANDMGYGRLDSDAALEEARHVNVRIPLATDAR